jgi:hypothetical protein
MVHPLLLLLSLTAAAAPPPVAVGVGLGGGVQVDDRLPAPAIDLLTLELRAPMEWGTLDVQLDWTQFLLSRAATTRPRLGVGVYAHHTLPLSPRWGLALMPGVDLELGRDAELEGVRVRTVPAGAFGVSGRVGFDRTRRRDGRALGIYTRAAWGFQTDYDGPAAYRRATLELVWTWGNP